MHLNAEESSYSRKVNSDVITNEKTYQIEFGCSRGPSQSNYGSERSM